MSKQTAIQLLRETIDSEMKLGTKMVIDWDMYLAMEREQRIEDISDEEIETAAHKLSFFSIPKVQFEYGAKWYRETLKKK
jgi:hypothetical protein